MGIWSGIKYALNSTLGTVFFMPLDKLLGAKILCNGDIGTTFTISSLNGKALNITVSVKESSDVLADGSYAEIIVVPLGSYAIKVQTPSGETFEFEIEASQTGKMYAPCYKSEVARFEEDGVFEPEALGTYSYIAAGGGGGGAGGGGGQTYSVGGGGGSGGCCVEDSFVVSSLDAISITIGKGGAGGAKDASGKNGGSTIINGVVTVAGGNGGVYSYTPAKAESAGQGSGAGGKGFNSSSEISATDGENGLYGAGGKATNGGGGGGSYGNGGDAHVNTTTSPAKAGKHGGGGGGSTKNTAGAAGGDGIVIISKLFGEGYV